MIIKIEVLEDDQKKIETHKWNTRDWDRLEKTWGYLRKKYGRVVKREDNFQSWVQE